MNDYGEMFYGTLPQDTQDFRSVLAGIAKTIRDRALGAGKSIIESGERARALQAQAFANPQNPLQLTNPQALQQLTDMIMAGPMGFAPAGITAYHGSRSLFRELDPSKIGTGEGKQAYGVGAGYTAEARPVGESYIFAGPEGRLSYQGKPMDRNADRDTMDSAVYAVHLAQGDKEWAKRTGLATPEKIDKVITEQIKPIGYLYKGDIPDEILPKFLDWDKPLKDQPEIKRAIQEISKDFSLPKIQDAEGAGFVYQALSNALGGQQNATKMLESKGIRGIRYLDQGSRGEGKGTSNFIPFRPEDFKIQEINDIPIEDWIAKGLL